MNSDELWIELKKCWDEPDREKGKMMEKNIMIKHLIHVRDKVIFEMALSQINLYNIGNKNDTNSED